MENLFAPIMDFFKVLGDAAHKAWEVARPVFMVGFLYDFVSGQLGWIDHMMGYYGRFMESSSAGSWFVFMMFALFFYHFMFEFKKRK